MSSLVIENCRRASAGPFELDPLRDPRWSEFVEQHPDASVFHSTGWLEALRRTYGYEPLVVTTSGEDEPLTNSILLCKVRSSVTGSRLVSLPFSDHCEPLVDNRRELEVLLAFLKTGIKYGRYRYLEIRPLRASNSAILSTCLERDETNCIHHLDLNPSLDELFRKFHKSCVQRKIQKAERAGLLYEQGRSEELLSKFYKLLLLTRRRHKLPPQSKSWFRNVVDCLGDKVKIRVVSKYGQPVASIITTQFRDTAVYKYGCSDAHYHHIGGTFLLMWRAIQDAKASGASCFDFGRSERDNEGLVTFKAHWGSTESPLPYVRYPAGMTTTAQSDWKMRVIQKMCPYLPDPLFERLGGLLYKHIG